MDTTEAVTLAPEDAQDQAEAMAPVAAMFGAPSTPATPPATRPSQPAAPTATPQVLAPDAQLEASIFEDESLVLGEHAPSRRRYNSTAEIAGTTFFFNVAPRAVLKAFMREARELDAKLARLNVAELNEVEDIEEAESELLAELAATYDRVIARCVVAWAKPSWTVAPPCTPENLAQLTMPARTELFAQIVAASKLGREASAFLS